MKVISNSLLRIYKSSEDAGDYPSNAGGSPKEPFLYLEEVAGNATLEYPESVKDTFVNEYTIADVHDFVSRDFYTLYRRSNQIGFGLKFNRSLPMDEENVKLAIDTISFDRRNSVSVTAHFELMNV